ncbi:pyruvate dehydrogenase complex dihydrolipoamide acetyltransferase, long form [Bernardetia litoralis DSM 6794]|uniref:Acetyltransferase component of pyruvate dehydrogenase complex n=1 Tax=Bernardetia litoralis (strain ATCC 23117 / DSM 6794 / NBRC 15988 / NCIMB 1366 / Fx l1 / Sio-4) TaxID=880071 RepID=I4AF80_BERLS|nr:pyruvate dehydrogenase complex dihydrolipoamide acetyltransferase [Bernardetia litoralis]AFM02615.1 pyruvate dehydrogenase complex dihydrolipoamide acetyltransferase, long form [Bernardetia litoralis DSM 6794]
MAEILIMPRLTDTMEEGVVASILVKEGDTIKSGDLLAEIETDKATMEWESFVDGEVLYIGVTEGEGVPVNDPVLILGKKGEDISALKAKFGAGNNDSSEPSQKEETKETPKAEVKKEQPKEEESTIKKVDTSSINAVVLRMRKMTDTMEEGVLASWLVKVGDKLKSGDVIAEVETDKATMDFDIYDDGEVLYLAAEEGDSVPIDAPIAVIGEKGADYQALLDADNSSSSPKQETEKEQPKQETQTVATPANNSASSNGNSEGRIFISPLAKKMAEENGYDINQIDGSGENGRITKKDIENFTPLAASSEAKEVSQAPQQAQVEVKAAPAFAQEGTRDEKVSQMRKAIAKSLSASKFTAPHFYLTIAIDMDKAIETRKMLNELSDTKISFNDIVIKSTALALKKHPAINASWQGDTIRYNDNIHMGVAVAVDEGLLVPVVRFAEMKTLSQINKEVKEFAGKAKDKKLQPSDWEGSTFTISNLGMFGIEEFTAIINAPNACILAVGTITQQPVVKEGEIVVGNIMKMTLSCDHRVVDGAVGAAFLQTLKGLMENPLKMLV